MPSKIQEEWRPIVGTDGAYEVSNLGRVRSVTRRVYQKGTYGGWKTLKGSILKPIGKDGTYLMVNVGKRKKVRIHKLVAEAFVPRIDGKRCVDHIDGDKSNNAASNLRWCTHKENNNNPSTKSKLYHSVVQIDPGSGKIIRRWDAITIAKKETGILDISKCCRQVIKTAGGYIWRYETSNS